MSLWQNVIRSILNLCWLNLIWIKGQYPLGKYTNKIKNINHINFKRELWRWHLPWLYCNLLLCHHIHVNKINILPQLARSMARFFLSHLFHAVFVSLKKNGWRKKKTLNIFHLIALFCFVAIISHYNDLLVHLDGVHCALSAHFFCRSRFSPMWIMHS